MQRYALLFVLAGFLGCDAQSPRASNPSAQSDGRGIAAATASANVIEGKWRVVSLLKDGQEFSDPKTAPFVIEFRDGQQTILQGGAVHDVSQYSINTTTTPQSIDTLHKGGQGATATTLGIYEVTGNNLKLCMGGTKPRPQEFASTPNSGYNLIILERMVEK